MTMYGYIYKDLTDSEKRARREALDGAGIDVFMSQIVLFIAICVFRALFPHHRKNAVEWFLLKPISLKYPILKTPAHWLVIGTWMSYCFFLVLRNTGDDYLHLTKAFGTVAVANLPFHFLFASKRFILAPLLSTSYESLNFFHRWLGRIITILLSGHAFLYLNFFYDTNRLTNRFLENDVQWGFWSYLIFTTISSSANHWVREWSYRLFYTLHITLPMLLFPMLYFHVSHLRPYLIAGIAFYIIDHILRYFARTSGTIKIRRVTPNLIALTFTPKKYITIPAGSHALLNIPSLSSFASNPFSIAAASSAPGGPIKMVARVRNGTTKKLAAMKGADTIDAVLESPYGAFTAANTTSLITRDVKKVIIIAGGVGGTFATFWVPTLVKKLGKERVRFVWSVRTIDDVMWAFEENENADNEDREKIADVLEIHLTGSKDQLKRIDKDHESVELSTGLLVNSKTDAVAELGKVGIRKERIKTGRPKVRALVEKTVEETGVEGRTLVLVCGPGRMGGVAKKVVAEQGMKGRDVYVHVEEFGH
ncbi:hypothetical protein EX30DRAFT_338303 [Ascodesmis nigricans]|uniref:ferric-chelate reductase (NADPH) n=1 Tax=Ascodesmis nigricans TaxID=341454 RepID=A0A4S2N3I8_9PEZI|nr:hypothetical protein EX30DRAFT_338303 [Ascodesmis nigricans]